MNSQYLTIKELVDAAGSSVTPRMVRHYHRIGLLPDPVRSPSNYRLYTPADVQRLRQVVKLKQQGFQLAHIRQLLAANAESLESDALPLQLQHQYQKVMRQLVQLRQTAVALESILGQDLNCPAQRAAAIAQLQRLDMATPQPIAALAADSPPSPQPEAESLQRLLPDLSARPEIEVDLISKLVMACGDVSLVPFVRLAHGAIAAARQALGSGCLVVGDIPAVAAAFDHSRLAHLGCRTAALLNDPHIASGSEAEQLLWRSPEWPEHLRAIPPGAVIVVGYAPSVLTGICDLIERGCLHPALVIGLPIGFSHAPTAKRRLLKTGVPCLTIQGSLGGGLLAATALNALADSLIEKPHCHCYLTHPNQ
ncbi:precorrin-8X methylmutase [Nodosilinea nodulosa]|uniref:precorrin-8X methylmutase n=1 Tax=Nodosilinea nodulosa TaxID=416001 RepID=UPI0002D6C751|nr:precorrin-8X methylmutase [Nodosilinea nodulosa]